MDTKEVKTTIGSWVVKRPLAGVFIKAMAKAEMGDGSVKKSILMSELVPPCIVNRPESIDKTTPIEQVLDGIEIEDYVALFEAIHELMEEASRKAEEKKTS
jgi:hypothetical protein